MSKPFQKCFEYIYKKFSENPAGMLITTSVIGWMLSSLAQIIAITVNPKIKEEQKVFLIPQEFNDALVNIGAFLLITQLTKKTATNLFTTGKFAPKCVKEYLNKTPELKSKVGKLDFNLDEVLANSTPEISKAYKTYKSFGTTVATIGAGVFAANVVTPLLRNKMASRVQKTYINTYKPSGNKETTSVPAQVENIQKPLQKQEAQPVLKPEVMNMNFNGSMRI